MASAKFYGTGRRKKSIARVYLSCWIRVLSVYSPMDALEGDAGAPLEEEEFHKLREILPEIWNDLSPKAQEVR